MARVTLTSCDNKEFSIEKDVALESSTIKDILDETNADAVHISRVRGEALGKVIEYCIYHRRHPDPPVALADQYRTDLISPWDKAFMDVEMQLLFEIVLAANYLDIKGLLDLGCKTIANMIKGGNPNEVREKFRIPDRQATLVAN